MNKTQITFYSGLDTVGGVVMEIRYENDRIILEMGSSYNPSFDLYDGNVAIRNSYVSDGIWMGDVPEMNGLFRREDIQKLNLCSANESSFNTAVLLTHLHLDHMSNMGLVDDSIPIYLSKSAQIIEQALEDMGEGVYSIHHNYLDIGDQIQIGNIHVKPFVLNPDSYKDYSFFIETPDLKLHYTGDVFVYGVYEQGIKKELEFLKEKKVDVLICEGTGFLPSWLEKTTKYQKEILPSLQPVQGVITENEFLTSTQALIQSYDGLLIFNYYEREICHVRNWLEFANNSNRIVVFEPKSAYILNRFLNQRFTVMIPDTYDSNHYPAYLTKVISDNDIISKDEVLQNPNRYIVQNTFENILELFDYRNTKAMYLHHSGVPLGDYDPHFKTMMNILEACHITYHYIYKNEKGEFFTHAIANQLLWYIHEVNPKLLIPSHCPNRKLEGELSGYPYYLCDNKVSYYYDEQENTLKEVKLCQQQ